MKFQKLNYTEPAVLRGIATSAVGLLASLGVVLPSDLGGQVDALIVSAGILLPLIQSVWTRAAVFSPATHAALPRPMGQPQTPGVADHAAPTVASAPIAAPAPSAPAPSAPVPSLVSPTVDPTPVYPPATPPSSTSTPLG